MHIVIEDVEYSKRLCRFWSKKSLSDRMRLKQFRIRGTPPHGAVLETLVSTVTVNGNTGSAYVKTNYGGKDITSSKVANNRQMYQKAVTVIFKREKGYDFDNKDWYWVKYTKDDGSHKNPKGMRLAGRVAKGMKEGCIACHKKAGGGYYLYNNDAAQLYQ